MICVNCSDAVLFIQYRHKQCINDWGVDPENEGVLVKRPEPIKSCACQHKDSWQFVKSGDTKTAEKTEGNHGNGS